MINFAIRYQQNKQSEITATPSDNCISNENKDIMTKKTCTDIFAFTPNDYIPSQKINYNMNVDDSALYQGR